MLAQQGWLHFLLSERSRSAAGKTLRLKALLEGTVCLSRLLEKIAVLKLVD
jgi:hypothetical protein